METTIYKITFTDGREYRVFCANKSQKKKLFWALIGTKTNNPEVIVNGIHTAKQFINIIK